MNFKGLGRVALIVALVTATIASTTQSLAQGTGSKLAEAVASHEVGDNAQIRLESVAPFDSAGGEAIIEPGTSNEEKLSYDSVDLESDRLIGLDRPAPGDHPVGAFVEAVAASSPSPSPAPSPSGSEDDAGDTAPEPEASPESGPSPDGTQDAQSGWESQTSDTGADAPTSAGVIPDPCDSVDCDVRVPCTSGTSVCDEVMDLVLSLLDCSSDSGCTNVEDEVAALIYDVCGSENLLACNDRLSRVVEDALALAIETLYAVACPGSADALSCLSSVTEEVNRTVDTVVYVVCRNYYSTDALDCANDIAADAIETTVNTFYGIACPGAADAGSCLRSIQGQVGSTIDSVVYLVCRNYYSTDAVDCVNDVANDLISTLTQALYDVACSGASDVLACVGDIRSQVDQTVASVVYVLCRNYYSTDAVDCVNDIANDMISTAIRTVYDVACPGETNASACVAAVEDQVHQTVDTVVYVLCRQYSSTDAVDCVNDIANNVIENAILTFYGVACPGATSTSACLEAVEAQVSDTVDTVVDTLCRNYYSTDAVDCVNDIANDLVQTAIRSFYGVACPGQTNTSACVGAVQEQVNDTVDTVVYVLCRQYSSTDAVDCVNDIANNVIENAILTFYGVVCPGQTNTSACVGAVQEQVNDTVDTVVYVLCRQYSSTDAVDCVNDIANNVIENAILTFYATACPGATTADACLASIRQTAERTVKTVVDTLCGHYYSTDAVDCVNDIANDLVQTAMRTFYGVACPGETNTPGCLEAVEEQVNDTVDTVVYVLCRQYSSTDAVDCVNDIANNLIENAIQTFYGVACPGATTTDACLTSIRQSAERTVKTVVDTLCRQYSSTDAVDCVNDIANDLIATAIETFYGIACPGQTNTSACLEAVEAQVDETVDSVVYLLCRTYYSTDAVDCAGDIANDVLTTAIRTFYATACPGATATDACISSIRQTAERTVKTVVDTLCRQYYSTDAVDCVNDIADDVEGQLLVALEETHDLIANVCNGYISTSSTDDSAVTSCIDRVFATVASIQHLVDQTMVETCGSTAPAVCVGNLLNGINAEITKLCGLVPGTSESTGAEVCTDRALQILWDQLEESCLLETSGCDLFIELEELADKAPPSAPPPPTTPPIGVDPGPSPTPTASPTASPTPTPTPAPEITTETQGEGSCLVTDANGNPVDPAEKDTLYPALDHNKEHMSGFEDNRDNDGNGVHDSHKPHGSNDFPNKQFHFDVRNGRQFITIEEDAKVAENCIGHGDSGGDVGIHRTHKAKEDEIYGAKAKVRITDETEQLPEDFKSRLTIHARDENGKKIPGSECNAHNAPKNQTPDFVIAEIFSCPMLDDTGRIRIATRAHAVPKRSDPLNPNLAVQGWGTVAAEWVSFTKKSCGGVSC